MAVKQRSKLVATLLFTLAIATAAGSSPFAAQNSNAAPDKVRNVEFSYQSEISGIDPNAHEIEAWIPLPRKDEFQHITGLTIATPIHLKTIYKDADGNEIAYFKTSAQLPASIPVKITFQVRRTEETPNLLAAQTSSEPADAKLSRFLQPDKLVPTGGKIQQVSATIGHTQASRYEQARAIYDYVVANMKYDKSGTGWGRGDALYACDVKKGNCTDFHSLFIAIARSRGIPARFTIGFPLGAAGSGEIPGYHCWAEFYSGGEWVPVDASEAWKHPERRNYYFGHLDADRVAFTMGRDLVINPPPHAGPLNFLIYPYFEIDGKPAAPKLIKNSFRYSDVPAKD